MRANRITIIVLGCGVAACAAGDRRFPLREPLRHDADLASVRVPCHPEPTARDPRHVSCAPAVYDSPLYWDGADNILFRPLSDTLGIVTSGESVDVNSLDEVPDSSWFVNRIGARAMSVAELRQGACSAEQILDPDQAADGSWVIDKGKQEGSTPGFRVVVPGKGKYMLKVDTDDEQAERMAAASTIGAAIFHAVGYFISCERIVHVRPSVFRLTPGLTWKENFQVAKPFDQRALDDVLAHATKRNGLVRMSASAWIAGHAIGPARFHGTRDDDPNDVIPHEDRRELRGMRVLAAWLARYDSREANSLDTWIADQSAKESSPGHVVHYQLDVSEVFGSLAFARDTNPNNGMSWEPLDRRLNRSYFVDWGDFGRDFVSLGLAVRPWERVRITPGHERFGYYDADGFDPEKWKPMYPNAAFSRMSERDGAWMARILARFTPEMIRVLARLGDFSEPETTDYLESVIDKRLHRVLDRWLTRLSPIADVRVEDGDRLCAVDLAERRGVLSPERFHYAARYSNNTPLTVVRRPGGAICIGMPHVARDDAAPDDARSRYVRVIVEDSVARGPLVAHLYDLGSKRGFRLVGLERPPKLHL